jgi:exopolysaccharide biosynthesis protein
MYILRKLLKFFIIAVLFMTFNLSLFIATVRLGVFPRIKVLLVTSSMTTMRHQFIAKVFASKSDIKIILELNQVEYFTENSIKEVISVINSVDRKKTESRSEEEQIPLSKDTEQKISDTIELVNLSGNGYKGYMLIISNPKRVVLATTKSLKRVGTKLNTIIKENDGIGGINAGGFVDEGGKGNGGTPCGLVIENGEIKHKDKGDTIYSVVGLDEDGVLILGHYNIEQISQKKIIHAVSFYPFLIVNGKPTAIKGDGGWGINPRTAIGQREDGTILMLVVDGRQTSSVGTTIKELQKIMLDYGAVNATNLDGGSSTVMYYKNKLINKPCSPYGERPLPTAFIIKNNHNE